MGGARLLIEGSPARALERTAELNTHPAAPANVVSDYIAPAPARYLPQMLVATTIVAVVPLASSLALRAWGLISSGWLSVAFAIAFSLGASAAGSAYWRKHGASEVLFSELLLWGWIRRWRQERELANATRLLQPVNPGGDQALTVERREHLLRQLAGALEGQDVYLNGHSRRVARHAMMIARGMGLPSEEVARIRAAAAVHDVGKLLTPKSILNKPGRLTDAEFEVIKRHPVDGAEMVAALGDPELTRIVRHHHERLDGAGYPDGLAGDEIPLGARVIAVADTFDAITSARPYRAAAPHQKAIDIMRTEAGAQLDPEAVRCFMAYYSGSRPTMVWALVTSSIRRVVAWLSGDPAAAATLSAGKVAVATVASAAIGVAAAATPVPRVHPLRPVPVTSIEHAALPGKTQGGSGARHAPVSMPTRAGITTARPIPARRPRGAHASTARAASRHHRSAPVKATPRAKSSKHTPGKPGGAARTPSVNPTSSTPSANHAGPSSTPAATHIPQNSAAGGASSRPTSTNPAGHVNHASSTGNAARNGQPPHSTPPGHAGSSQGGGSAGAQNSRGNGGDHSSGNGNAQHAATPPASSQPTAGQQTGGNGQGNANAQGNGSSQGNGNGPSASNGQNTASANAQASASQANGNGNPSAALVPDAANGNGKGNGNGNANGNGHS